MEVLRTGFAGRDEEEEDYRIWDPDEREEPIGQAGR